MEAKFTLLLTYDAELGLGVGSVWQFPCPEMSQLYNHFRNMRHCEVEPSTVITMLAEELDGITAVRFGYWTHIRPLQLRDDA